jgi:hypothetical protein
VERHCAARFLPTGEETQNTAHQNVEWRAGVALSEVSSSKAADETFDFEPRHSLVAKTEAGFRGTAEDQAKLPFDRAIGSESENPRPAQDARAASKSGQVVRVFQIFSIHHVANIKQGSEGSGRVVPNAPFVVKFVGNASIEDEAPERIRGLIDSAERFYEERRWTVWRVDFDDSLAHPGSELDTER